MSVRDAAIEILADGLEEIEGEEITYRRESEAIDGLVGVPAATRYADFGSDQVQLTGLEKDWLIRRDALVKAGTAWTPKRGDLIDWTDAAGVKHTYEVLPRAGERVFRPTDSSGQLLRIFTIEIKAAQ